MSARDDLAELIDGRDIGINYLDAVLRPGQRWASKSLVASVDAARREIDVAREDTLEIVDRILTAGWRPPARVVTTREELDALPRGTVMRDADPGMWLIDPAAGWEPEMVALPAVVLYDPRDQT